MTLFEHYKIAKNWQRKIAIISYYHNAQILKNKRWSIRKTASYFKVSIGLVSENLRLANRIEILKDCKNREDALARIKNG